MAKGTDTKTGGELGAFLPLLRKNSPPDNVAEESLRSHGD